MSLKLQQLETLFPGGSGFITDGQEIFDPSWNSQHAAELSPDACVQEYPDENATDKEVADTEDTPKVLPIDALRASMHPVVAELWHISGRIALGGGLYKSPSGHYSPQD